MIGQAEQDHDHCPADGDIPRQGAWRAPAQPEQESANGTMPASPNSAKYRLWTTSGSLRALVRLPPMLLNIPRPAPTRGDSRISCKDACRTDKRRSVCMEVMTLKSLPAMRSLRSERTSAAGRGSASRLFSSASGGSTRKTQASQRSGAPVRSAEGVPSDVHRLRQAGRHVRFVRLFRVRLRRPAIGQAHPGTLMFEQTLAEKLTQVDGVRTRHCAPATGEGGHRGRANAGGVATAALLAVQARMVEQQRTADSGLV